MGDSQYGLMNILAVQTLFIEHPLYNQRLCTQVILNRWQRKTFSKDFSHLVTQPRYCSSLRSFFHFAVILLSWMKRWMKACSYPYARMRQSLLELQSTGAFLCPQHLWAKGGQGLWSCVAGSCFQHLDKHMAFEWTTRWVENWLNCLDGRVVISSSKSKSCPSGINGRANTVSGLH